MSRTVSALVVSLLMASGSCTVRAENWQARYDASLGTLPTAQGWSLTEAYDISPAPYVSSGTLHQGMTSWEGCQYWVKSFSQDIDMSSPVPFSSESRFKVSSSSFYESADWWRNGFYVVTCDRYGRYLCAGFSSSGISLITGANEGVRFVPFDTTSTAHTYRTVVASGTGELFADDVLIASTPIGYQTEDIAIYNGGYFGDGTIWGNSEVDIEYVRFGLVPEPSSILALLCGIGGIGGLAWKKRTT